jgi:hypothetical protein
MLRGAASALSRSADSAGVLVIGGLLTLLAWVVTPIWFVGVLSAPALLVFAPLALAPSLVARGYFVRVVADAASTGNRDGAPSFVAWNRLYRDGLKSLLLSVFLLTPLALLLVLVALATLAAGASLVDLTPAVEVTEGALGSDGVPTVLVTGGGLLVVVVAAYLFAFAYVRPAALAVFAGSGRLRDALRPSRIAAVAGSGAYATAWLVALVTLGAGYALAAPFVPLVVGVVLVFVTRIAAHALYGRGAASAVTFDVAESVAAVDQSASPAVGVESSSNEGAHPPGHGSSVSDRPDGGFQPPRPEVPVAVQTGRTVALGNERHGATEADAFQWSGENDPESDDGPIDRQATDVPGFEWGTDADPEDKS